MIVRILAALLMIVGLLLQFYADLAHLPRSLLGLGIIVISCTMFLSTRLRVLEPDEAAEKRAHLRSRISNDVDDESPTRHDLPSITSRDSPKRLPGESFDEWAQRVAEADQSKKP